MRASPLRSSASPLPQLLLQTYFSILVHEQIPIRSSIIPSPSVTRSLAQAIAARRNVLFSAALPPHLTSSWHLTHYRSFSRVSRLAGVDKLGLTVKPPTPAWAYPESSGTGVWSASQKIRARSRGHCWLVMHCRPLRGSNPGIIPRRLHHLSELIIASSPIFLWLALLHYSTFSFPFLSA